MRGQLRKARRAIIFFFTGTGCIYGLLTARLPALQAQLQVGEALIGMAMLCLGCGSLAGFAVMHFLQRHCGAHHMLRLAKLLSDVEPATLRAGLEWIRLLRSLRRHGLLLCAV